MSTKFILEREIAFINRVNKELIQSVVGEEVYYYEVAVQQTRSNKLYGEAAQKTWKPPVKLNALVKWDNPTTEFKNIGADAKYTLEAYCHTQELDERNLLPKEGDFVEYGQVYFEVTSVTNPQLVFGQVNNKILTKLVCVPAREGQFAAGGKSSQGVDHSHPVNQVVGQNK